MQRAEGKAEGFVNVLEHVREIGWMMVEQPLIIPTYCCFYFVLLLDKFIYPLVI
jgi:hypothetical protein